MKLLILEDSPNDIELLEKFCNRYSDENGFDLLYQKIHSPNELPKDMTRYQAALLDIMIEDEPKGIEVARELRRSGWQGAIAFITSSTDFYPQGFEVNAVHYLVKPLVYEGFCEMMTRIINLKGKYNRVIELPVERSRVSVKVNDILYAEVFGKTTILHLLDETLTVFLPLKKVESLLGVDDFLRCFRSYIVNLAFVEKMEDEHFIMKDGAKIPIDIRHRQNIRSAYLTYRINSMKGKL